MDYVEVYINFLLEHGSCAWTSIDGRRKCMSFALLISKVQLLQPWKSICWNKHSSTLHPNYCNWFWHFSLQKSFQIHLSWIGSFDASHHTAHSNARNRHLQVPRESIYLINYTILYHLYYCSWYRRFTRSKAVHILGNRAPLTWITTCTQRSSQPSFACLVQSPRGIVDAKTLQHEIKLYRVVVSSEIGSDSVINVACIRDGRNHHGGCMLRAPRCPVPYLLK